MKDRLAFPRMSTRDQKAMADPFWIVYLLKCSDNTLYCGCTNNLEKRINAHNAGKGAKYTKGRRPISLAACRQGLTKSEAHRLEYVVKRMPKKKKCGFLNSCQNGMAG